VVGQAADDGSRALAEDLDVALDADSVLSRGGELELDANEGEKVS
jgi:hypothetical protein